MSETTRPTSTRARGRSLPSRNRLVSLLFAYAVTLPAIVIILITVVYPVYYLFKLSMSEVRFVEGMLAPLFIGLVNFQKLASDPAFLNSTRRTLTFVVFTVPISIILGLAVALAMNNIRRVWCRMKSVAHWTAAVSISGDS